MLGRRLKKSSFYRYYFLQVACWFIELIQQCHRLVRCNVLCILFAITEVATFAIARKCFYALLSGDFMAQLQANSVALWVVGIKI